MNEKWYKEFLLTEREKSNPVSPTRNNTIENPNAVLNDWGNMMRYHLDKTERDAPQKYYAEGNLVEEMVNADH